MAYEISELFNEYRLLKEKIESSNHVSSNEILRLHELMDAIEKGDLQERIDSFESWAKTPTRDAVRPDVGFNPHQNAYPGKKGEYFSSLGEQLVSIYRASQTGQKIDERLFKVNEAFEKRAATGLGEGIPADGAFLLEQSFTMDLVKEIFETGQLARLCYSLPITKGNSTKIPAFAETSRVTGSRLGGIQAFWTAEAGEKLSSKPKFRQMELSLKKLTALTYGSEELLEDTVLLEAIVRKGVTSEFGFQTDDAILNGSGVGQNGPLFA
jgi:HK97 family phage major capsid protein